MVPWCRQPIVVAQWIHHTPSVPWRMVRTPGGIEMHRTTRTPLFGREREGARERERETEGERERERVERSGKGTERCNRREREGESKREWKGESRRETHRARDRGLPAQREVVGLR